MKVSLKQIYSIVDGRLSTDIGDVYLMLNAATGRNLFTHQLPDAMREVQKAEPEWYKKAKAEIDIVNDVAKGSFVEAMNIIDEEYYNLYYEITLINPKTE